MKAYKYANVISNMAICEVNNTALYSSIAVTDTIPVY